MIRVLYKEPELKDIVEGILGKNFFIFVQETITDTLRQLDMPARLMNDMTVTVAPHDEYELGRAQVKLEPEKRTKGAILIKIQDTPGEMNITLRHETIHLLKPNWDERTVEIKAKLFYTETQPKEFAI